MCEANSSYHLEFSPPSSINAQLTLYGRILKKRYFFWNYKNSLYICPC
nr:MAG TPA: CRISPR-associated protein [Microviridae sp.]